MTALLSDQALFAMATVQAITAALGGVGLVLASRLLSRRSPRWLLMLCAISVWYAACAVSAASITLSLLWGT